MNKTIEELTVHLIIQDMRHFQLISHLEVIGFETDSQLLNIGAVVAGMIGIEREKITEDWWDAYVSYLNMAIIHPMHGTGEQLRPLAEQCYRQILRIAKSDISYSVTTVTPSQEAA